MPFELNPANGQWEFVGEQPDDEAPVAVTEPPAAPVEPAADNRPPAPEAERNARPWFESFLRYNPLVEGAGDRLKNDLQFEMKQFSSAETAMPRLMGLATRTAMGGLPGSSLGAGPGISEDISNTTTLGTFKAGANVQKNVLDLTGQLTPEREGEIDRVLDLNYEANGFRPPSQMTDEELGGDDMRSSLMLNLALALITRGASVKGQAALQGSGLAARFPFLMKGLQAFDVAKGKGLAGKTGRFAVSQLVDEIPSTYLDDNTNGSFVQLLAFLGVDPETVQNLDPVNPGQSRTEASNAALLPNFIGALGAAGGLYGLAKSLPATKRAIVSSWEKSRRQKARTAQVEAGEVVDPAQGEPAFTMADYEADLQQRAADEGKLESDTLEEVVEGAADTEQLDEIITRQEAGENTVDIVEDITTRESSAPIQGDASLETTAAPRSNLANQDVPIAQRFSSVPTDALRSLAANSPDLAARIAEQTGRAVESFDRTDIFQGIESLEATGNTVMPSRLMGQPVLRVDEIEVDPKRFQFKQGTDAQGQQRGNSLSGVDVYNEGMEGQIQVWTDPMDGKNYVVNGHNRLALAKSKGIPSMKVEYLNAASAEEARALGALNNIAQGGGTMFDAAKFMRDAGIKDPQDLESIGVPMKSGLATEGLALSRLPDNIFQDAVDGRLSKTKALALGGSGLDETGMQAAYKALMARDMSDSTFNEVLQQARSAGTAQGDQVDLFGNTETLSLMVQKGELAGRIRKDLMADKNLMKRTAANANRLQEVGNEIDKAGTASLADDTAALLAKFDADKYMETPLSQKLNEGAAQMAEGGKTKVIADRIRRELIAEAEGLPAPERAAEPAAPAPEPTRQEKMRKIVQTAAKNGDVRPPSTPLPDTPAVPKVDPTQRADVQLLDALNEEFRLREQYGVVDDAMAADKLDAERQLNDYDLKTFEEKKSAGMLDWMTEDEVADRVRAGDTAEIEEAIGRKLATEKTTFMGEERVVGEGVTRPIGNTNPERPWEQTDARPTLKPNPFKLPADVAKSKPRFGMAQLQFASDLDRAAYIIRNKAKASKGEARIIAALEAQGYDIPSIRARGDEVKQLIQDVIEEQTGSRRAPQEAMTLEIPDTDSAGVRASQSLPQASRSDEYDEAAFRKRYKDAAEARQMQEEAALMDIGLKISDDVVKRLVMSQNLAREMVAGLKEAARISGLDPLRIQYLDTIDMKKLFGEEAAGQALGEWNPDAARFVSENPDDPLSDLFSNTNTTGGVFVPRNYPSIHKHMIYLAMGPNLDKRLASKFITQAGGMNMAKTPYHEAFHAVQDWLEMMDGMTGADSLRRAINSPDALVEMQKLVKNDQYGTYQRDMAPSEIQAEAFAVWYNNRQIKLKAGGLQKAFERIKMFINTLRKKMRYVIKKDPTYVDVFELAAEGRIADVGNQRINKLTPQQLEGLKGRMDRNMDQMMPMLTDRVHAYLKQKQADFDLLSEKLADEIDVEGC